MRSREQRVDSDESDDEWSVTCRICGEEGDETQLLLCDGEDGTCNNAYHTGCIGLDQIPRNRWLCPECQSLEDLRSASSEDEESLYSSTDNENEEFESEEDEVSLVESSESDYELDIIEDELSDPEADYVPEEEEEDTSPLPAPRPKPKKHVRLPKRRKAPRKAKKSVRRSVRTMDGDQRRKYIQDHVKVDYQGEDPLEEAWMIYNNLPRKRTRSNDLEDTARKRNVSSKSSSEFLDLVEEVVNSELEKFSPQLANKENFSERYKGRLKNRIIQRILETDNGREKADARAVQKMKACARSILNSYEGM